MSKFQTSLAIISSTVQLWTQVFWFISIYFNTRNTLLKSGTFLYIHFFSFLRKYRSKYFFFPLVSTVGKTYQKFSLQNDLITVLLNLTTKSYKPHCIKAEVDCSIPLTQYLLPVGQWHTASVFSLQHSVCIINNLLNGTAPLQC